MTQLADRIRAEHSVNVTEGPPGQTFHFVVNCSCGWTGRYASRSEADVGANSHVVARFRAAVAGGVQEGHL